MIRTALTAKAMTLLVLGLALASPLDAQTLKFQGNLTAITGTYVPDTGLDFASTLTVRHRGTGVSYFLTFSAGQSGSFTARNLVSSGNTLSYQIYDSTTSLNVLKDLTANPTSLEVLSGSFVTNNKFTTQTPAYVVRILPAQLPTAGTYTDTVTVQLYSGTVASPGALTDSATFTISITVAASLDISIGSVGEPFNSANTSLVVDFGAFSEGGTRTIDLVVRSNTVNSVSVTSQGGGVMKNTDLSDASQVPYSFTVGVQVVALVAGTPVTIVSSAGPTGGAGQHYTISVVIDPFGWATAGSYSDLLTFQAAPN